MKHKVFSLFLIVVLIGSLVMGCKKNEAAPNNNNEETKVVLKLGSIHAAEDLATQGLRKMAEIANEKSNGSIEIEIYPASQLGDAIGQMEAVMIGTQDMFFGAAGFLTQFVPDNGVAGVFFCFKDSQHFEKYLESDIVKDNEAKFLAERGTRIIDQNWRRSPRVMLSSKGPIRILDDLKGLKVRVPEIKTFLESVKILGANPTPVPWGEVYLALTQGVVNACESPIDMIPAMNFHEAAPHVSITNHVFENDILMINEKKFAAMSDNQKKILVDAAKEAGDWYNDSVSDNIQVAIDKMQADGATLYEVDIVPFVEVMIRGAQDMEARGLWTKGLFEKIQNLK